jgi:hypothetical protein
MKCLSNMKLFMPSQNLQTKKKEKFKSFLRKMSLYHQKRTRRRKNNNRINKNKGHPFESMKALSIWWPLSNIPSTCKEKKEKKKGAYLLHEKVPLATSTRVAQWSTRARVAPKHVLQWKRTCGFITMKLQNVQ